MLRVDGRSQLARLTQVQVPLAARLPAAPCPEVVAEPVGAEELQQRLGAPAQQQDGAEHHDQRGGDQNVPLLRLELQVEAESVGDGAAKTCDQMWRGWVSRQRGPGNVVQTSGSL